MKIIEKGDVVLTSDNNIITLRNTFHIPSLPYYLFSQTSLWNGGAQIVKKHGHNFEVTLAGKKLFEGKIKNHLPFPDLERKRNTCQMSMEEHKKMGHPGGQSD